MKRFSPTRRLIFCALTGAMFVAFLLWKMPPAQSAAQGCSFTINPTGKNFASGPGAGGIGVSASSSACNWTAVSNDPWISITAGASGTGNGLVGFSVAANIGAARTGTITVAGQTFTVNQDAGAIAGLQYYALPKPIRLFDTRAPIPGFAACEYLNQSLIAGGELVKQARITCDGVTIPSTALAIVGNATVVNPSAGGFITLWPDGQMRPPVSNLNFTAGQTVPNAFTVGLSGAGNFRVYSTSNTNFILDITGYFAPPAMSGLYYHPLPKPIRLFDTRAPIPGFAACEYLNQPLVGGGELLKSAHITCDGISIPANALAIVGNATVVNPSSGGFVTLFPNGQMRPPVSNLNFVAGQTVPNAFTVGLDGSGQFRTYSTSAANFIVDVTGYYSQSVMDINGEGLLYSPLPKPIRLYDTRAPIPGFPACEYLNQPINADSELAKSAHTTCDGITIPPTAKAVVGNATVVAASGNGFITLFPDGQMRSPVSNLNYVAGQTVPNAFTVGLSLTGGFRAYSFAGTHFITDVTGYFASSPTNIAPMVDAGTDQTVGQGSTASLIGYVSDDGLPIGSLTASWSKVSGPGTVTFGNANQAATTATFSATGVYVLRLTGNDSQLTTTDDVTVTVNGALMVNAGTDQVITLPNSAMLMGAVTGGAPPVATSWSKLSGPGSVIFSNASSPISTAIFGVDGIYVLRLTAMDAQTTLTDDVMVTVNPDPTSPPPDPMTVAPPIDMTVATTIGAATEFLYTGANPIQTGVAPGTINSTRAAVLKGRVLDKNNNPLRLVKITVLGHPEFGQTMSRADGRFDLAVNGGGVLTIEYEKVGFQTVQRTDNVPWQDYFGIPDVVMIGYDSNVTLVDLLAATPVQVAQSSVNIDTSGTRRTALLFKQGTTATMKLPGGAMVGLDKLHVRATEFTVGTNGQQAMPGSLPANSGYTYAVDYSIDEAVAAGALETTFNQPVAQYNENFLHFAVGTVIPSGAYDPTIGQWIASASGRVVKILSITSGTANLDVNGAGVAATGPEYAALGINTAERQSLATLYTVNQSLWRVPVIHFTKWDSNWPFGPPPGAEPPSGPPPECDT